MEVFPKDIQEKILNELSPQDFVRLCAKKDDVLSEKLCNDNEVWYRRLQKDFGMLNPLMQEKLEKDGIKNYKNFYLKLFIEVSNVTDYIYKKIINNFGNISNYLNKDKLLLEFAMHYLKHIFDLKVNIDTSKIYSMFPSKYLKNKIRIINYLDNMIEYKILEMLSNIRKILLPLRSPPGSPRDF